VKETVHSTASGSTTAVPAAAPAAIRHPVFINGRFLTQKLEGVQRTAEEVVRALDAALADGSLGPACPQVTLLAPRGELRGLQLRHIEVRRAGRLRGNLWEQLELPWLTRAGVLVSFCNAAPLLKRRQVVTLHDAAVYASPEGYSRLFATWYRFLFAALGRTARVVLTVSHFSRRELALHAGVPAAKLRVVRQGAQHLRQVEPDPSVVERHRLRDERFVLAVGSLNPNKNFRSVLAALASYPEPRPKLVVAGGVNNRVFREGAGAIPMEGATYVGYVTDAQLKSLYTEAAVFVFPSLYEGFGLPPLEAMSNGCPAVVSDIPVLREVCGDAAEYCDPRDPASIAGAIRRVLEDEARADELRSRGRERARAFTWEGCAREVWAAVREAADAGQGMGSP
jgi:glycosyltransferase involved in cell wall biosynthesis